MYLYYRILSLPLCLQVWNRRQNNIFGRNKVAALSAISVKIMANTLMQRRPVVQQQTVDNSDEEISHTYVIRCYIHMQLGIYKKFNLSSSQFIVASTFYCLFRAISQTARPYLVPSVINWLDRYVRNQFDSNINLQ